MAYSRNQEIHQSMLRSALNIRLQEGAENIRAGVAPHARPAEIAREGQRMRPDITAEYWKIPLICDVETDDTIAAPDTGEKFRLLSDYARENGACFLVVVPKGCARQTRKQLAELHAPAENIWEL